MTEINVFTDGSHIKSGHNLVGCGIHFQDNVLPDMSIKFTIKPLTHQRAELYAIYIAIMSILEKNIVFRRINIYSDSEYSVKSLNVWINNWKMNNWKDSKGKPVKNQDLIKLIHNILIEYGAMINIVHIYAHTGGTDQLSIGNNIADRLAKEGALNGQPYKQPQKKQIMRQQKTEVPKNILCLNDDYSKIKIKKIGDKNVIVMD